MGNSQWEREWNGLHNWESRAHRLHEVIGTQHQLRHHVVMTITSLDDQEISQGQLAALAYVQQFVL